MQRLRRSVGIVAVVAGSCAVDGCSFLVDSSGLTPREGSEVPDGAASDDAAIDAIAGDGAADAADAANASLVPACGPGDFADDFEGDPAFDWTRYLNGGATGVVDEVRPHRGKRSLHLAKLGSTNAGQGMLHASFAPGVTIEGCSFDIFVDRVEGSGSLEFFKHTFDPAPNDTSFSDYATPAMQFVPTGSGFEEMIKAANYVADGLPLPEIDGSPKRWFHVDTVVETDRLIVAIDGTKHEKKVLFRPASHLRETIAIGMNYEGDGNRWEIFVDDVCCRPKK